VRRRREPALSGPPSEEKTDWVELVAAVLFALATVATAWSGYQASRWNGEQAKTFSRANAARVESTRASDLANAQTQIDVATFIQWVDAYAHDDTELADFYADRFRPEFESAMNAWLDSRPLLNPDAAGTPFALPEYQLAAREQARELGAEAEMLSAQARANVQRATNYVLAVVLFATALFFAGMAARFRTRRLRIVLLAFGVVVLVGTVAWLATFPVSISV
jgi:hypothetical protein